MHANTSTSTEKTCLRPTTDSGLRPIILMVVSIFHPSTNGSDRCCTNIINVEINSRCPEVGRKRRPPTAVHVRERETRAAFATRKDTSASKKKKIFRTRLRAESSNFQTTFLKNCTKVKTDVENCRWLQLPLLCKAVSKCLHSSRSK